MKPSNTIENKSYLVWLLMLINKIEKSVKNTFLDAKNEIVNLKKQFYVMNFKTIINLKR